MLEILMYFVLVLILWVQTGPELNLLLKYLYPHRPIEAYHLYGGLMGSSAHILRFSLQLSVFSLCMAMRILFSMFWFEILIFSEPSVRQSILINIVQLAQTAHP